MYVHHFVCPCDGPCRGAPLALQVLMPARRENQAQQWLRQPAMERAAARLRASRDAAAILETVQCGPVASVQPVLVLVTGYTVSPSARQEASAQGIVVLDLPVLQPYWAPRLQHCTSPLLDHLKPRAVGAPAAVGAS